MHLSIHTLNVYFDIQDRFVVLSVFLYNVEGRDVLEQFDDVLSIIQKTVFSPEQLVHSILLIWNSMPHFLFYTTPGLVQAEK